MENMEQGKVKNAHLKQHSRVSDKESPRKSWQSTGVGKKEKKLKTPR